MTRASLQSSWLKKVRTIPRRWLVVGAAVGMVLLIAYALAFLIDEPLRRYTEAKMNRALKGYTVHLKKLDFHPVGFSLDLQDVLVVQFELAGGPGDPRVQGRQGGAWRRQVDAQVDRRA